MLKTLYFDILINSVNHVVCNSIVKNAVLVTTGTF